MDDRVDTGLLFVMLDREVQTSLDEWDGRLRALPGAAEVTWWDHPSGASRGEEVAALDVFGTLAIVEFKGQVDPSIVPAGAKNHILFRRYPRPSQGRLRPPTLSFMIAMVSPHDLNDAKAAQALRNWADFYHIPNIIDAYIPGYAIVTPYENVAQDLRPRFLHLYEYSENDGAAVFARSRPLMVQRFGGGAGNPGYDYWTAQPTFRVDYVTVFNRIVRPTDPSLRAFPPLMLERPAM